MTPSGISADSAARPGPGGWALFLDFDGTIVDIALRPEAVVVEPSLPALLRELRARLAGALAIVTGRPVADLDGFLPGLDLDACGMHGLERRLDGHLSRPEGLPLIGAEVAVLRRGLARHHGVVIEDKGVGVAVHWRTAPDAEVDVLAAMSDVMERLGPGYRLQDGKAVREIVPAAAGKGAAIRALLLSSPYLGRSPVFLGDDRTDENGFGAVNEIGGISVKVGPGPTIAGRRLASPAAVRMWLRDFAASADGALGALTQA